MKAFLYVIVPGLVAGFAVGAVWYPLLNWIEPNYTSPAWIVPWTAAIIAAIFGYGRGYKPAREREFGPNGRY